MEKRQFDEGKGRSKRREKEVQGRDVRIQNLKFHEKYFLIETKTFSVKVKIQQKKGLRTFGERGQKVWRGLNASFDESHVEPLLV